MNNKTKIVFAVVLALVIMGMTSVFADVAGADEAVVVLEITVRPGDTVWATGKRFARPGEDIRAVVERIYKENNLYGRSIIQPGQKLRIPVYGQSAADREAAR